VGDPTGQTTSCAQVLAQNPLATDGTYTITFAPGLTLPVYCAGMLGTSPQAYLTLPHTGPDVNYTGNSYWQIGAANTSYTRVHLVPFGTTVGGQTCNSLACIDTSDPTFATATGNNGKPLHYGQADTCGFGWAYGNIDLTGTPFAVAPNAFLLEGWAPSGGAVYSAGGQVVNLSAIADCGDERSKTDPILPLTVVQQAQTITFPATAVTYGEDNFSPATASSGLPVSYSNASGDCTIVNGLVHTTGAGSCTVTADQSGDIAHSAAPSVTQTFPVSPGTLTVDAQDATTTYGQAPTLTSQLDGFVNGDTASSMGITGSAACSVASVIPADAGAYQSAIDCSPGTLSSPNYTFVSGRAGTLTITPAVQTISLPSSPVTYGQADFNPASASSGLPVSLSDAGGACSLDAQGDLEITGAGGCTFTAKQTGDDDYQGTGTVSESLTVSPATVTVDAQDATTTYGTAPSLTSQLDGFVNSDTARSAGITGSPSCSVAPGTSSDAGNYPQAITCSTGTLASPNGDYTFTTGRLGTLTINPAPQTIAFPTTGVTYGQPDYSPASSTSGLGVSYTNPSGVCAVDQQGLLQITGAGNCTVTATQAGSRDYQAAAAVTQTITVAKAPLTVDANPASTVYGHAPSLSATPHGFVNGDTVSSGQITGTAACTVASGTGTDVGTYSSAVTCAPGSLSSANYSFVAGAPATLTITPASQAITLTSTPPATPLLGGTYTVTSKAGGSGNPVVISVDGASTSGACKVSSAVVSFSGVGTCVIDANQAATKDYAAAPQVQQKFVIEQPTTTVVTSSANPSISGQSITLTATVAGPAGSSHVPGGTITFENGSTKLGTATLSNGTATLTSSTLSQATHAITVVYGGDTLDQGSTSSTLSQQVLAANAGGVTSETTSFVESSPKFQALPPATQKAVSTMLSGVSSALASFTPTLTPAQLKVMTTAYDAAITALQNQGYLTAGQAGILDGAAGDLS
jgi:Bacterial Ig-like domain (group 3)/MBG domain (YGX type)/GON domain